MKKQKSVKGPAQPSGKMGWKRFVSWARGLAKEPETYPRGYNRRSYLRACGGKLRTKAVFFRTAAKLPAKMWRVEAVD